MLPFVNNCLSHLFPQAALAETLGMTLRESHQICQLDLGTLTEPLQVYIPKEEDIQIPLKKLEANSQGASASEAVPEAAPEAVPEVEPSDNPPNPEQSATEVHASPQAPEESPEQEDQNCPVVTPEKEAVEDTAKAPSEQAEPSSEMAQSPSEEAKPPSGPVEASEIPADEAMADNQPETEVKETKKD